MYIAKTQKQKIRNYLRKGNRLTPLEALKKFGSLRLAAIVFELREEGMPIKTEIVRRTTRHGAAMVALYSL